jgi:AcrR family transcriptional regulator
MARRNAPISPKNQGSARRQRLEQKDSTRHKIYEAARKLFVEKGYFETRSADIAAAAGVSTGSIFAHFGSKAKIMTILQREEMGGYLERIRTAQFSSHAALSRIDEFADFLWTTHLEARDGMKLMRASMSYTWSWDDDDEAAFQDYLSQRRQAFRTILEGAEDWPSFNKCADVEFALRLFQAFHAEVIRESVYRSDAESKDRLRRALIMLFGEPSETAKAAPDSAQGA